MAGWELIPHGGNPLMAQFLSPDPYIQSPGSWYNYNRYGYCLNNPLLFSDPSGYIWGIFKPFVKAWNWIWNKGEQLNIWWQEQGLPAVGVGLDIPTQGGNPSYNASYKGQQFFNSANLNQVDPAVNVENGINQMRKMEGMNSDFFASHDRIMRERIYYNLSFNSNNNQENQGPQWTLGDGVDFAGSLLPDNRFIINVDKLFNYYSAWEIGNDLYRGNYEKAVFGTIELAGGVYTVCVKAFSSAIQTEYSQRGVGRLFYKDYMDCLNKYNLTGKEKYIDEAQQYYELMYRTKDNLYRKR